MEDNLSSAPSARTSLDPDLSQSLRDISHKHGGGRSAGRSCEPARTTAISQPEEPSEEARRSGSTVAATLPPPPRSDPPPHHRLLGRKHRAPGRGLVHPIISCCRRGQKATFFPPSGGTLQVLESSQRSIDRGSPAHFSDRGGGVGGEIESCSRRGGWSDKGWMVELGEPRR